MNIIKLRNNFILSMSFILVLTNVAVSVAFYDPDIPGSGGGFTSHLVSISGYVKDSNQKPLSGVRLSLTYGSPGTGIYKTATTSSSGYYSIVIMTSLYVTAKLTVSKEGYITQTADVYTKGYHKLDFILKKPVYSIFHIKVEAPAYFQNKLVGNVADMIVQLYSSKDNGLGYDYAIIKLKIRTDAGTGAITLQNSTTWVCLSHSYRLRNKLTNEVEVLDPTYYTVDYGPQGVYYSDKGYDLTNYVVEADFTFKLIYDPSKSNFMIRFSIIDHNNYNTMIGLEKLQLEGQANAAIKFDNRENMFGILKDIYLELLSNWNQHAGEVFSEGIEYEEYFDIFYDVGNTVLTPELFGNNPNPYFVFEY